jgi:hypothetical protein
MATKLAIFNNALGELGHRRLADTGEPVEAARELVAIYDKVVAECLAAGTWNFAIETATVTASGSTPALGFSHVYTKPSAWVKTEALASDSGFTEPVLNYYEDATYWAADTGELYVRYVSSDTGKGLDLPSWGEAFSRYVELELAFQSCMRLTSGGLQFKEMLAKLVTVAKETAIENDSFLPSWPTVTSTTTSRLRIIHSALNEMGDIGKVAVRGEDSRRVLDRLYDEVVQECLAAGSWNFAMETVKLDADTGVTPEFGFPKVFAKPTDWVRTMGVSEDEYFAYPLLHYYDDDNFLSSDNTPIYVRYVSNDTGLGLDRERWPANFTRYVVLELALRGSHSITQSMMGTMLSNLTKGQGRSIDYARATQIGTAISVRLEKERDKAKITALNHDAMNEANPKFPPPSSWTRSRWGQTGGRRDRGSRGSLTG